MAGGDARLTHGLIRIDGSSLTLEEFVAVSLGFAPVALDDDARRKVLESRRRVESVVESGQVSYGITTGFGKFSDIVISAGDVEALQQNLISSHAAGTGSPFAEAEVRGMMLLRANALAKGYSGVRAEVIDTLLDMLNKRVCPVIPEKGSLGASGDLAPLAHMVLVMLGRGQATYRGSVLSGDRALKESGIDPLVLQAKEGLSLINGTQAMTSVGALALWQARNISQTADVAAALSFEGLRGVAAAFDEGALGARPHPGAVVTGAHLRELLSGSSLVTAPGELRVQDAYSMRCVPQVHGALKMAIEHVSSVLDIEMNSATDNPLVIPCDGRWKIVSCGNFHGQPVSQAMDYLGISVTGAMGMAERRINRLLDPASSGLPAFLTSRGGLCSGFMILHYTAAALLSECKILASPACVDSIPVSAGQEDHVSMGTIAARKARDIVQNASRIVAIELMCAAQALDFLGTSRLSPRGRIAYEALRSRSPALVEDRVLSGEIDQVAALVSGGDFVNLAK
jgi:histidine ammonia-lyase